MRPLSELINTQDPAWPLVQEWIAGATNPVEVLPVNPMDREAALLAVQVTTRSPMGAIVYETGGLLIDHGWLRILGSGHPCLPRSLDTWRSGDFYPSISFDQRTTARAATSRRRSRRRDVRVAHKRRRTRESLIQFPESHRDKPADMNL